MKTIGRAIGFVLFAALVQFLFWVTRTDIVGTVFNVFDGASWGKWLFMGCATVLLVLLDWSTHAMRPVRRHGIVFGILAGVLVLAWAAVIVVFWARLLPGEPALGIGILVCLGTYWIINVAVDWLGVLIVETITRKNRANQASQAIGA